MERQNFLWINLFIAMFSSVECHAQFFQRRAVTRPCPQQVKIPDHYHYNQRQRLGTVFAKSTPALLVTDSELNEVLADVEDDSGNVDSAVAKSSEMINPNYLTSESGKALAASPLNRQEPASQPLSVPEQTASGVLPSKMKFFQWPNAGYQIQHCSLSNVAFHLFEDGTWVISLRADQNSIPSTIAPVDFVQRAHVRRNLFGVKMTLFAGGTESVSEAELKLGLPALGQTESKEFWVQKQQPDQRRMTGKFQNFSRLSFSNADRVQLEFYVYQ
ncbi:MAG: hypothetical protein AAF623_15705 [Planctomycetota bacterium]